jgi:aldehyde dehydrogenase (NAD+)
MVLHAICRQLQDRRADIAEVVAAETGKGLKNALLETEGAIQLGLFFAGEGQRLFGRTTTSGLPHKSAMTVREPLGVAALIVAANTPIANVAWKVFPALICGNSAVLKAAEDAPATAALFAEIAAEAGLPAGVLNVIHGLGEEAGEPLVSHPGIAVVSFTGSTEVGRRVAIGCAQRLTRVSLELGGKNPLVVCDDADLEAAVEWAIRSAFSNAGQRCAAGSRLIVFSGVYERFRTLLIERTERLRVGPSDADDLGPLINERHLDAILSALDRARASGVAILTGGVRVGDDTHRSGYYLAPTVVEPRRPDDDISTRELFGPVTNLYRASGFDEALALANTSPYGLTAAIHTRNVHRAMEFTRRVQAGVAVVNAGTYGSEPHMPFGGVKQSGNGSREPGTEALDVYSNLKDVYIQTDPAGV